jgi:hypothetical protein
MYRAKHRHFIPLISLLSIALLGTASCGGGGGGDGGGSQSSSGGSGSGSSGSSSSGGATSGGCDVPALWSTATLTHATVGNGTAQSCTRDALATAVANGGYVTFDCGGSATTIAVGTQISVSSGKTTIIDGGGTITLDGGGGSRIFQIAQSNALSVRNLTLKNGYSVPTNVVDLPDGYSGGAIAGAYRSSLEIVDSAFLDNRSSSGGALFIGSDATLTIIRSTFSGNSSWYGGAIMSMLSGLTVVDSTFTGNSVAQPPINGFGQGGAITTDGARLKSLIEGGIGSGGTLSVCGTTFRNNSSQGGGGGVWLWSYAPDNIIVKNSTFEGNTTQGLGGAGRISVGFTDHSHQGAVRTTPGTINIGGSSFLGNSARANGGALYVDCYGDCNVANSTFYGNSAGGVGGAIQHVGWGTDVGGYQATTVSFNNVTFVDNANANSVLFGSRFALNNTVLVSHTSRGICSDSTSTGSHVLQYSSQGATTNCLSSGTILTSDPLLAAPADNGGPTYTMLPAANSPLLNAGTACMAQDQRGHDRNTSVCDIGAVELP